MRICHSCKREIASGKIGRRDLCEFCRADLYCCLNCLFYDPQASKQCREPVAELVKEKKKANYCEYFRIADSRNEDRSEAAHNSRKALEDLFKR